MTLSSGDLALQNILQGEGYSVQVVDDDAPVSATASATDLIVIGASTSGTSIGSKYAGVEVPEVVMASSAWDSMGLTEDDGSFYDSTTLAWVNASSPIASWLPSPVQVVPTDRPMRSMVASKLADGAAPIAVRSSNTNQNVVFTIDAGGDLTTGTAPARRAVAGLSESALANLTTDGAQLIVNLVTWAAEGDAPLLQAAAPTYCGTYSSVVACYEFNDSGTTMVDSTTPTSSLLNATGTSGPGGVKKVKRDSAFAEYFFSGWKGHTSTLTSNLGELSSTDTLGSTFGQALIDKTGVTTGETFNPGTGNWRIATRIKPYLVKVAGQTGKHLPAPSTCTNGCGPDAPSYNLVQKGRNGTSIPGGFYKVEIMGYAGSFKGLSYVKGSVHCVMRDGDGTTYEAFSNQASSFTKVAIDSDDYYTIDCLRSVSNVILKVTQQANPDNPRVETVTATRTIDGTPSPGCGCSATALDVVSPSNGNDATAFSPLFSIGKKPQSTHIEDSFSGWIDYLVLATQ